MPRATGTPTSRPGMKVSLDCPFQMGLFKVLQLQLHAAPRTGDWFSVSRRQDFLCLKDSPTDMKEMPAGMLFIQGV